MSSHSTPKGGFSSLPEVLLVLGTVVALLWSNSAFGAWYELMLETVIGLPGGAGMSLRHLVNDGLMVIFFFLIGLEVKKELVIGHLSTLPKVMLPLAGAVGGMVLPGLIFVGFVWFLESSDVSQSAMRGWAIPAATDIAFALGVLRIVGRSVPLSLRIFLSTLAIADDLGAIVIIALFYSSGVNVPLLCIAGAVLAVSTWLGRVGRLNLVWVWALGVVLWVCVLNSGVHATIAGVALAFTIPASAAPKGLMMRMEHGLKPWVDFAILPIFALFNAGIPLAGLSLSMLFAPVTLGVSLGLFIGKQLGVWLGVRFMLLVSSQAQLPASATARQFYGVCVLTGIGFTMSLFIAALAYPATDSFSAEARVGVLVGSLLSILWGAVVLGGAKVEVLNKN